MSKIQVNKIANANVYLEGGSLLGRAEEITLPEITAKMAEHKALGMVGELELPSGIGKMEAKAKWSSLYPDVMRRAGDIFRSVSLQVRGSLETYGAQGRTREVPVVVSLTGTFKKLPMGVFKQHEAVAIETDLAITYCKLVIDGEEIVEFDAIANIYKVGGQDVLATYRRNIGG